MRALLQFYWMRCLPGCFLVMLQTTGMAQYYNPVLGKTGQDLKTGLHQLIKNHSVGTYADLWSSFYTTDKRGSNQVWDIYSDIPGGIPPYTYTLGSNQCGTYNSEGDCYNREHLWPAYYFNDAPPMYTDLQAIYPTDGYVNNKHGNLPFGHVNTTAWTSDNGSRTGTSTDYPGYTLDVFEPIDSFKGDIARVYFYMSTRYESEDAGWLNWTMGNGAALTPAAINVLMSWHHLDPVSLKEVNRNAAAYLIQGNRNPFIDYPIFADCIWGTTDCTPLQIDDHHAPTKISIYPNPSSDQINVSLPNGANIDLIEVFDVSGRLCLKKYQSNFLYIGMLTPGYYRLRVHGKKQIVAGTLIKN